MTDPVAVIRDGLHRNRGEYNEDKADALLDALVAERDEARLERDAAGFFGKHQTEDEYFLALRKAEAERNRLWAALEAAEAHLARRPSASSLPGLSNSTEYRAMLAHRVLRAALADVPAGDREVDESGASEQASA